MNLQTYIEKRKAEIANNQKAIDMLESLPEGLDIVSLSTYGAFTDGVLRLKADSLDEAFQMYDRLKAESLVIVRGNGVQVIYGPHVTIIKNEVEEILS